MGMRKIDPSRLRTREALAGVLLALSVFVAAVLAARLPGTRPLGAGWTFTVALILGGMCTAGTHLLLTSGTAPIAMPVRLLTALFSAGTATVGILATTSTGSAASFAGGCVSSLLVLGGSVALAILGEDTRDVEKPSVSNTSLASV